MPNTNHQCFVGNLAYNTTEEGLRQVFSVVGEVVGVRILTDRETGRPRGYAFIEYADAATALSAIRNLDKREFNGRELRVSYSNNSNLKEVAREMGHVVQDSYQSGSSNVFKSTAEVVADLQLHEAHDILAAMKHIIEEDSGARAKMILEAHPQLIPALVQIQCRLGMAVPPSILAMAGQTSQLSTTSKVQDGAGAQAQQHQQHLYQQVLQMSEEDLDHLPLEDRQQMLILRDQLRISGAMM